MESDCADIAELELQHNDKPKPHKCTMCDKRFATKGQLSGHFRTHKQQNSYSCPHCEKCYTNCNSLRSHIDEFIRERNRSSVQSVANDLRRLETILSTAEFIVERNHTNAANVESVFD